MASIDPRLLELVETLMKSRLDWLVFEMLDGIQRGRAVEETEEDLAAARAEIRRKARPTERALTESGVTKVEPIEGDEQVYVGERLASSLAQLEAAVDTLESIVGEAPASD